MGESRASPLGRRQLWLGFAIFAVVGAAAMVYLNGSGLTSRSKYHGDLGQSPHWIAYHGDAFAEDDLLVEYATFNESPLQNSAYWVGTWFVDVVPFNKLVGVAIFGLTAGLFFVLVASMSGPRVGFLASVFFIVFPRSTYEIAGGFSKGWAIGLVLIAVYVVETRAWRVLPWVMPLAALAYPISPVLIGAIVAVGLVIEYPRSAKQALLGLKQLALASALALGPLLYKYLTPPGRIGAMISPSEMRGVWERGENSSFTLPLWEEVFYYLKHPFFIIGAVLLAVLLWRRGIVWKRSWSALVIASTICYFVADAVVPRLYLPDRYTRFSMAVLLVLWFADNWGRVHDVVRHRRVQGAVLPAVVVLAFVSFSGTFRPCDGDKSLGLWEDKGRFAPLSRAIAALPPPVLVASHPYYSSEVMVQSRQPVLVIHRMFHYWYADYHREIDGRIRSTFRALFAKRPSDVNKLVDRYGVTHLVVPKRYFDRSRLETGNLYRPQFRKLIAGLARGSPEFVLDPPPSEAILFEDGYSWLVRLPLREPALEQAGDSGRIRSM